MYLVNRSAYTAYSGDTPVYMEKLELFGDSSEDKGTLNANNVGSTFLCTDNGDTYIWSGTLWWESNAGIKEDTIGNLHELDTTEKGEIVGAINEVLAAIPA